MVPRAMRTVRGSLLGKGFAEEEGGAHRKLRLQADGNRSKIYTFYSHGARECDDYILGRMAKHLRLSRAQLDDLIDCTLSGEAYAEMLRELGEI